MLLTPATINVTSDLPVHRLESIAKGDRNILSTVAFTRVTLDNQHITGNCNVNADVKRLALVIGNMRTSSLFADDHAATDNIGAETLQLGHLVLYPLLDGIRMIHTVERNLNGNLHQSVSLGP